MAANDGKVSIGVELEEKSAVTQATKLGKEVGSGIEGGIKGGTEKSGGLLTALKGKFSAVFAAIGGIVAGFSMAQMAAQIVQTGKQFEESMSKVAALSGATGDDLARLEEKARELGATTTFSASEAADALGYMALAGWDTEQMLEGVDSVLTLAQAGMMDLAQASDLVTDYLSAFGMETSETGRMVDVLAYAQANANTTVEGLGMAFKNAAANAHAAGLDVETTTAAISMLANQGLKGSEAGTALTAVMRDMTAKMKDGAIAIGDTSVTVMDAQGNYRDFTDIIADVEAATDGMGAAEKAAALQATFTADSIKGLNLILNAGSGELKSFREELYGSAGAGKQLADTMTDNLEGDIKALNSALEELQLKIYDGLKEPLRDVTKFATSVVVPALTTLVQNFDKFGPILAALGVSLVAYRKNWDIVTTAQKLATKATEAASKATVTYKKDVIAGETALYKLDKTTGQYVRTKKTLASTIATTTVGMKAQTAAQTAMNAAMELGSKASKALGTALKTIAPMAILTVVIEVATAIAGAFSEAQEEAAKLEKATNGLRDASSAYSSAMSDAKNSTEQYASSVQDVIAENKEVIASQADLADSIKDTWSQAGTSAGLAEKYMATIEELTGRLDENGNAVKLSASEQARLKMAVDGLNSVTGESYQIVDAVNGVLSSETSTIRRNTDEWKKNAKAQAAQSVMNDLYKRRIELEQQLEKTAEARTEAQQKYDDLVANGKTAGKQLNELNQLNEQYEQQVAELEAVDDSIERTEQSYIELTTATHDNADATGAATEASGENAAAMEQAAGSAETLAKASDATIKAVQKAAGESATFADAMTRGGYTTETLAAKLDSLGISAEDLAKNVESMASKASDAFSEIEQKTDVSLDKMMQTMVKNRQATENWANNLTILYDRAGSDIERRFLSYIANLGPEYAPILQQLVDDSSGKLTELANEWAHGVEVGGEAAVVQAGIEQQEVVDALGQGVDPAGEVGDQTGQEYAGGIEDQTPNAVGAGQSMAQETLGSIITTTRSRMPLFATEMRTGTKAATDAAKQEGVRGGYEAGAAAGDSEMSGYSSKTEGMRTTGRNVAGAGVAGSEQLNGKDGGYFKAGASGASSYGSGMASKSGSVSSTAGSIGSGAAGAMDKSSQSYNSGRNVTQGFISGMTSISAGVRNAARNIAQSAIDTIKQVGREGSPWKTTIESGKFAGEGLAVGLEQSESMVRNRAGRLSKTTVEGINAEGGSDGVVWDTTRKSGRAAARGLVVGFEGYDPIAQIEASIEKGASAMAIAAAAGSMSSTTNNQTLNFNQPVQSPDQIARTMRMQQRYGLAGRR